MEADAIVLLAVGVSGDHERKIKHLTNVIEREGFQVIPNNTPPWVEVVVTIAGQLVSPDNGKVPMPDEILPDTTED